MTLETDSTLTKRGLRLAFVGKPNSGQTSCAVYLKRSHGFKRIRLMQGVARIAKVLYFHKNYERIPWAKKRAIYDALYKVDKNIWIGYVENRLSNTTEPIVIDDAKFLNEVMKLKELGFIIIRVNTSMKNRAKAVGRFLGPDIIPGSVAMIEYFNKDPTEALQVDYSIYHDGTLKNLYKTLDELLTKFDIRSGTPL